MLKRLAKSVFRGIEKIREIREEHKKTQEEKHAQLVNIPAKAKESTTQKIEIDIPAKSLIKALVIIGLFVAATKLIAPLQGVLIITGISIFLAMGLTPIVEKMEKYVTRPIAILLLYVIFIGVIGVLFVQIIPIVAKQLVEISSDLAASADSWSFNINIPIIRDLIGSFEINAEEMGQLLTQNLKTLSQNLQSFAGSTFSVVTSIFQGVFNFIFTLAVMFFILMEREMLGAAALKLFPAKRRAYVQEKATSIQYKMSRWFRGQIILMVSVGVAVYLGMLVFERFFGMQYAATIGLLAGVMELFPYVGLFLTYIVAGVIALNVSPYLLLLVIAWIAIVQFLEGNLLVPVIMEKVVGLPSVIVILALAIGAALGNAIGGVTLAIVGMILSIPVAASIALFVGGHHPPGDKD